MKIILATFIIFLLFVSTANSYANTSSTEHLVFVTIKTAKGVYASLTVNANKPQEIGTGVPIIIRTPDGIYQSKYFPVFPRTKQNLKDILNAFIKKDETRNFKEIEHEGLIQSIGNCHNGTNLYSIGGRVAKDYFPAIIIERADGLLKLKDIRVNSLKELDLVQIQNCEL